MAKIPSGQTSRSANRVLQVLKCFTEPVGEDGAGGGIGGVGRGGKPGPAKSGLTNADISRRLQLAPATVARLLAELKREGFIAPGVAANRYVLGPELIALARASSGGDEWLLAADPVLDELAQKTGEAVELSVLRADQVLVLKMRKSHHLLRVYHRAGDLYPAYLGSAAGVVLLAGLAEAEILARLPKGGPWPRQSPHGSGNINDLLAAVALFQAQGFLLNDQLSEPGVWAVAAPVHDRTGLVIAALTLPCPATRAHAGAQGGEAENYIRETILAARDLSQIVRETGH